MSTILPVGGTDGQGERRARRPIATLLAAVLVTALIVVPVADPAAAIPAPDPGAPIHAEPSTAGTADWIGGIAEAITALTILVVIVQLRDSRKTARIERTRGFQERYQSDLFDAGSRRAVGCLTVDDPEDCVAVIEACSNRPDAASMVLPWPDSPCKASVADVTRTLNFFEEMGAAYSQKQLDDKALIASFSVPILQVMVKGWWWICWEREGRLAREVESGYIEEGYVEHQDMALALRKEHPSFVADPWLQTNDKIRALCLPKGAGENAHDPDDALAWAASRRLSSALSTLIVKVDEQGTRSDILPERLARVSAELGEVPSLKQRSKKEGAKLRKPRGWEVFLIPRGIDQPNDEDWGRRRREAHQLAKVLNRFEDYPSLEAAIERVEELATSGAAPAGSGGARG
jgi:hypothetical protein